MTDEQMNSINAQFSEMREGFARVEVRFKTVDDSLASLKAQVAANEAIFNRADAEVHRQGLLVEERHEELTLGIEAFQTTQRVTNAKIDLVGHAMEDRLVPMELATRTHASTLADHSRRFETADGQA